MSEKLDVLLDVQKSQIFEIQVFNIHFWWISERPMFENSSFRYSLWVNIKDGCLKISDFWNPSFQHSLYCIGEYQKGGYLTVGENRKLRFMKAGEKNAISETSAFSTWPLILFKVEFQNLRLKSKSPNLSVCVNWNSACIFRTLQEVKFKVMWNL